VTAPYRRIVDQIRGRIAAGELRPGDRIPSARQLTRDWGVAIATATKALGVLQQEGLTVVRPGIGTVVAEPRRRATEGELTRDRIVRAATAIADAEGMAEVSMRRIATTLGAPTMSLYRHVPAKDDLVLLMIDAALGEERFPAVPPKGWRPRMELSARLLWKLFHRHPWLAPAMSLTRPQLAPNALAYLEWVFGAFARTGLDVGDVMYVHVMLFSFVRGVATAIEPEKEAARDTGLTSDEWMAAQGERLAALVGPDTLPALQRLARGEEFDLDLDQLFEFGLARLLDGVGLFVNRVRGRAR
jgi:DNA-binding transcriptional regulator YhcF (GntR family)